MAGWLERLRAVAGQARHEEAEAIGRSMRADALDPDVVRALREASGDELACAALVLRYVRGDLRAHADLLADAAKRAEGDALAVALSALAHSVREGHPDARSLGDALAPQLRRALAEISTTRAALAFIGVVCRLGWDASAVMPELARLLSAAGRQRGVHDVELRVSNATAARMEVLRVIGHAAASKSDLSSVERELARLSSKGLVDMYAAEALARWYAGRARWDDLEELAGSGQPLKRSAARNAASDQKCSPSCSPLRGRVAT